jgi:pyruvate/oxaloacetate carboxyltransferase
MAKENFLNNAAEKYLVNTILDNVSILDLRDGAQSLERGMRIPKHEIENAIQINKLAVFKKEYGSKTPLRAQTALGGKHDSQITYLGIDPVLTNELLSKAMPDVRKTGLQRSERGVSYEIGEPEVLDGTIRIYAESGLQGYETYSYANVVEEFKNTAKSLRNIRQDFKDKGVEDSQLPTMDIMISIRSPINPDEPDENRSWNLGDYKNFLRELMNKHSDIAGDKIILKDAIGNVGYNMFDGKAELDHEYPVQLVKDIQDELKDMKEEGLIGKIPQVHLHTHCIGESKAKILAEVIKAGGSVDVCNGDLANGTSHTRLLDLIDHMMEEQGYKKEDYQQSPFYEQILEIENSINKNSHHYEKFRVPVEDALTPEEVIKTGIGGGAAAGFVNILYAKQEELANAGKDVSFAELKKVAIEHAAYYFEKMGEPLSLTPYSKNISFNVAKSAGEVLKGNLEGEMLPLNRVDAPVIKHITNGFGNNRGYERGKGDVVFRDTAILVQFSEAAMKKTTILERVKEQGIIDKDQVRLIKQGIKKIEGITPFLEATKSHANLEKLTDELKNNPNLKEVPYLEKIRGFIVQAANEMGVTVGKEALNISEEARDVLLQGLRPGKVKIPGENAGKRYEWAKGQAEEIVEKATEKGIEYDKDRVAVLIAASRGTSAIQMYGYQLTGTTVMTKIDTMLGAGQFDQQGSKNTSARVASTYPNPKVQDVEVLGEAIRGVGAHIKY